MIKRLSLIYTVFLLHFALAAQTLPEDFYVEEITGYDYSLATGIFFDEIGRAYILEKAGLIHIIDTNGVKTPQPLVDIHEEVGNWRDHGLLGFALDPNFYGNGYFYLLYAVDRHHLLYHGTSQYHPDSLTTFRASIGRVTRYTADPTTNFTTTIPNSRKILLGESISTGIPITSTSHGVGTIIFAKDGTLLISTGDGVVNKDGEVGGDTLGTYATAALADGIITQDQDLGAYRSQYIGSLNGKVLRIDPMTGDGLSTNPFYNSGNPRSPQSRVWALGLRNPFRMTLRPNTGSHLVGDGNPGTIIVGDVGSAFHEELNIIDRAGQNFGWPLWEGHFKHWAFVNKWCPSSQLAPNPLFGIGGCTKEYFDFKDLLVQTRGNLFNPFKNPCDDNQQIPNTIPTFVEKPPAISWRNKLLELPPEAFTYYFNTDNGWKTNVNVEDPLSNIDAKNFDGACSIGGVFYEGTTFPDKYHNAYFHVDFDGWIKAFFIDENNQVTKVEDFIDDMDQIATITYNPKDECLYVVRYEHGLYKIAYGGNAKPVAVIETDINYGTSPLVVQFTGENSFDALGDNLTYHWNFGDGSTSIETNPIHTFTTTNASPTPFTVRLTVTDSLGLSGFVEKIVSLNNTPPTINIISFEDGDKYPMDKTSSLPLIAKVSDAESDNENLTYSWTTYLHHNEHFHSEPSDSRQETYTIIEPLGCDGETYFFRIGLEVTDEHGLTTKQEKYVYPNCEDDDFVRFFNMKLTSFADSVVLTWETTFEDSVLYFDVERSSDIWNFKSIHRTNAKGNLSGAATYSFTDKSPNRGIGNYRVKAYRANQAYDYSSILAVTYTKNIVEVYPNPSQGNISLYFAEDFDNVHIKWFNPQGQLMEDYQFENTKGNQVLNFQTQNLKNGVYFYQIQADDKVIGGRIIFR